MKQMLLSFIACWFLSSAGMAQLAKNDLDIQLNKNVLQPGDSLAVKVEYKGGSTQSLATLEMILENEQGARTRLRWPMINGQTSGVLYLPDSIPQGRYTLMAALQQRFFEVVGKIENVKRSGTIQAMLLTKKGEWDEQEVSFASDGTFAIRNWLFEDNALMAFSATNNNKQPLAISISTQLDSTYEPLAVGGRNFYIGNPPEAVRSALDQPVQTAGAFMADRGSTLPGVVVRTVTKGPAQQFNDEYVRGLFRSGGEKMLSVMEDPNAMSFSNILSYLQGRIAGLQISQYGFGGSARWRGSRVNFFLDEVRVPAQQIASIPMSDIAIVKAFPPPFMGAPGGGGAVAVYTRRGGETNYLPADRKVFRVRGYTPAAASLVMEKLSL